MSLEKQYSENDIPQLISNMWQNISQRKNNILSVNSIKNLAIDIVKDHGLAIGLKLLVSELTENKNIRNVANAFIDGAQTILIKLIENNQVNPLVLDDKYFAYPTEVKFTYMKRVIAVIESYNEEAMLIKKEKEKYRQESIEKQKIINEQDKMLFMESERLKELNDLIDKAGELSLEEVAILSKQIHEKYDALLEEVKKGREDSQVDRGFRDREVEREVYDFHSL